MSRSQRTKLGSLLFLASSLYAQENLGFHSCTGQIGFGGGAARGDGAQGLDSPGNPFHHPVFEAGGGFGIGPRFAAIFNYQFQQVGVANLPTATPPLNGGSARFQSVLFEPTFILAAHRRWNLYALTGFGWLRRSVKFTSAGGTLVHPGSVEAQGGDSADSGAFDLGAGANFRVTKRGLRVFVESRYLHGLARNFDSTLIPITAGIRW